MCVGIRKISTGDETREGETERGLCIREEEREFNERQEPVICEIATLHFHE